MKRYFPRVVLLSCLIIFFVFSSLSAFYESLTYDEIVHIQEGKNALQYHTFLIDTNNPPLIRELQTLPLVFGIQRMIPNKQANIQAFPARFVTIIFGLILIIGVYIFTKKYIGQKEALLAVFLLALEPNVLGHSHYVTQDIGLAVIFFFSYIYLLRLKEVVTLKNYILLGFLLGLGMAAKISYFPFIFFSGLLLYIFDYRKQVFLHLWKRRYVFVLTVAVALSVVWATYFFKTNVIIQERKDATRVSEKLLSYANVHKNTYLKNSILFAKNQKIPLGDYIGTLKNTMLRNAKTQQCFFLGNFYPKCQWYFMTGNLFFKLPLPLLIFLLIGIWQSFVQKRKKQNKYFYIPIVSILFISGITTMSPWVRYVLPIYAFIAIAAAFSLPFWQKSLGRYILFAGLLLWYVQSTLTSYPHFISYANEFAGYPVERYKLLADSNIDWGQSLPYIEHVKKQVQKFSYFGRDDGDLYGLKSDREYGSYKADEICSFHTVNKKGVTLISISNWYGCGYYKEVQYKYPKGIFSDSFLVF